MKINQEGVSALARGLIPIFRQTFTSYDIVNSIKEYLNFSVYEQEPLESAHITEEFKKGKQFLSYFSFGSKDEKQKLVFITDDIGKYTYTYFVKNEQVYQYTNKGAEGISYKSIETSEGMRILYLAKDLFYKDINCGLKLLKNSESPFVFN